MDLYWTCVESFLFLLSEFIWKPVFQHWLFEIFSVTTREQLWDFEHILLCLFEAKNGITFRDIIITYLFFYLLLFLSLCCCHSLSNIIVCYSPFLFFFSFPVSDSGVGVGCAGQTLVWVYHHLCIWCVLIVTNFVWHVGVWIH